MTRPLRSVAEYWRSKWRPGRLPGRADIVPEELRCALPFLYLVDVRREPLGFRFRLVGTAITEWAGQEFTGRGINEAEYGPSWRAIFEDYRAILERPQPIRSERPGPWIDREFRYYERFLAPLARDGETVDMILGALHLIPRP